MEVLKIVAPKRHTIAYLCVTDSKGHPYNVPFMYSRIFCFRKAFPEIKPHFFSVYCSVLWCSMPLWPTKIINVRIISKWCESYLTVAESEGNVPGCK